MVTPGPISVGVSTALNHKIASRRTQDHVDLIGNITAAKPDAVGPDRSRDILPRHRVLHKVLFVTAPHDLRPSAGDDAVPVPESLPLATNLFAVAARPPKISVHFSQ